MNAPKIYIPAKVEFPKLKPSLSYVLNSKPSPSDPMKDRKEYKAVDTTIKDITLFCLFSSEIIGQSIRIYNPKHSIYQIPVILVATDQKEFGKLIPKNPEIIRQHKYKTRDTNMGDFGIDMTFFFLNNQIDRKIPSITESPIKLTALVVDPVYKKEA